jgi:hypothetical protein
MALNIKIALALFAGLLLVASASLAQPDSTAQQSSKAQRSSTAPRVDIIPMGGYTWTLSQSATYGASVGDIDIKSGGFWGIAADIYAVPYMQIRLLYRRQDSKLTFKRGGGIEEDISDLAVEYWHIGAVKGIRKGNLLPYSGITLGATRFVTDFEDNWKFSILISLGAKIYVNDRIGLMVAGQMPFSFTGAFVGVGTGGVSIGGTGIAQFDVVGGLVITL